MILLFFVPLPLVLLVGWAVMWHFRTPARWVVFFGTGLAVMAVPASGLAFGPHHACTDSGLACVDDASALAAGNLLTGFPAWLVLVVVTVAAEVLHAAAPERPEMPADDAGDDGSYDRYPGLML